MSPRKKQYSEGNSDRKLSRIQKASTRLKAENIIAKTPRPTQRTERIQPHAPGQYTLLLNEYQRLTDLKLRGNISVEDKIKKQQIEAELDTIEAKQALEIQGDNTYRSDINKLERLIELVREIRSLV